MTRFLVTVAALALAGCAGSSAKVVSSDGGPSIRQAQAEAYNGPKQRIAVTTFDYRAGQQSGDIGRGMSDMLVNALFNSNRFIVLERESLDQVTAEQDLGGTGRFRQDTVAPTGELEGAQLLVRGSITEFEPNCAGGSVILASAKKACIAINIRIVDARSGRVVNATTVEGTSANRGVGLVYSRSSLPIGLGAYSNTPMETAIRNCIDLAVQHIVDTKI